MTEYIEDRTDFIDLAREEVTRAIVNMDRAAVPSYQLARQADGSVEAFADGLRVNGDRFWTLGTEDVEGLSIDEYLDFYGDEMRRAYNAAGSEDE